jgi:Fe-S-cluster containining protein
MSLHGLIRALTVHADYQCGHAGACCTAGWPIAVDTALRTRLEAALDEDLLATARPAPHGRIFLEPADGTGALLAAADAGGCVFFDATGERLCEIHRRLGAGSLPPSCRHFPRVSLLDARGVSITLSHYCPTAARMLFRGDRPLAIVENPAAFPRDAKYEGLDARDVLPPLLRPGLLWDLEGYSAWEREAVALLAREEGTPERALAALRSAAEAIERWTPARGDLSAHVRAVFARLATTRRPPPDRDGSHARVIKRYIAARLFASWVPYRADRLTSLVDALDDAHALLTEEISRRSANPAQLTRDDLLESIRATDFRIVHGAAA